MVVSALDARPLTGPLISCDEANPETVGEVGTTLLDVVVVALPGVKGLPDDIGLPVGGSVVLDTLPGVCGLVAETDAAEAVGESGETVGAPGVNGLVALPVAVLDFETAGVGGRVGLTEPAAGAELVLLPLLTGAKLALLPLLTGGELVLLPLLTDAELTVEVGGATTRPDNQSKHMPAG